MPPALVEDPEATAAAEANDDNPVQNFFLSLIPGSSLYYAYLDYQKGNYVGAALNGVEGLADLATVGSLTKAKGGLKLFVRFMKARVKDELVDMAANQAGNAVAERLGPEAGFVTQEIVSAALSRRTSQQTKNQLGFVNAPTRTLPNTTRGWKVGDPINNLTSKGNVPSWSAVRQRYWKNQAHSNAANYSTENLDRMRKGLAPQRINPRTGRLENMELHHAPPQREGGLFDVQSVWPADHALIDPFRNTGD